MFMLVGRALESGSPAFPVSLREHTLYQAESFSALLQGACSLFA
jgi:hypothetical protein